jgi:transposase-like protein
MVKTIFILLILIGTLGPNYGLVPEKEGTFITILGILLGLYLFVGKPIYSLISKKRNNDTQNNEETISEDTPNMKNKYTDEFKKTVAKEANEGSKTLKELGEKYNINPTLVRNWKIQFQDQSSNTPTEQEKKKTEISSIGELNSLSITNIQTSLSLDDNLDTIKNALSDSKSFIEQAKSNIKKGILTDEFDRLESAENYINDGFSLIQATSWIDVEDSLNASLTDAMVMIEDDAYEEGFDDPITFLKEKHDNYTVFIKTLIVDNFLYNAGYEFENLEWNEKDLNKPSQLIDEQDGPSNKIDTKSEDTSNIIIDSQSINGIVQFLGVLDDSSQLKENIDEAQQYLNMANKKVSEGSLGDEFNSLESAQNYLNDAYSLIKAKNWDEVILSLQNSQTDAMTMLSEDAESEESDDILSYLQDLHDTYEACVFDIVVHNFLYNAGTEFESLQW